MKRILLFILFAFVYIFDVNAKTHNNYSESSIYANKYIQNYNTYKYYIVESDLVPFEYTESGITTNDKFKKGGFLNLYEYKVSKDKNNETYLSNGQKYWTMTPSNNNSYMEITENDYQSQNETNESGSKITEFIKEETRISGSGTNGGAGTAGTNGGGGGSGYNYTHDVNCSSCHTGSNTCSYGCGTKYSSCATGSNTCAYGCDTRYDECLTGENTCKYGCDSETIAYKPGQGGSNIINSSVTMINSTNGNNSGNGKVKISYLREN